MKRYEKLFFFVLLLWMHGIVGNAKNKDVLNVAIAVNYSWNGIEPEKLPFIEKLTEEANVDIKWSIYDQNEWSRQLPLYMQEKKQPDMLFNFLLALFIYSMILSAWGDQYIKVQEAPLGMDLQPKRRKRSVFRMATSFCVPTMCLSYVMQRDMLSQIADAREVSVLRDGKKASVYIPEDMMQRLMADSVRFASFPFPVCD